MTSNGIPAQRSPAVAAAGIKSQHVLTGPNVLWDSSVAISYLIIHVSASRVNPAVLVVNEESYAHISRYPDATAPNGFGDRDHVHFRSTANEPVYSPSQSEPLQ